MFYSLLLEVGFVAAVDRRLKLGFSILTNNILPLPDIQARVSKRQGRILDVLQGKLIVYNFFLASALATVSFHCEVEICFSAFSVHLTPINIGCLTR